MSTEIEKAVMKNFTKALSGSVKTGMEKINEAIQVSTKFNSLQDVIDNMVSDCAKANSAENFMSEYCGIENQNVPSTNFPLRYVDPATGNITEETINSGWGVYLYDGKTYQDILPQEGAAVYPTDTTFVASGLTVTVPAESSLNDQEKLAVKGAYSWWLGDAVNLVEDTYNVDLNGKEIEFGFDSDTRIGESGAITKIVNNDHFVKTPKMDVFTDSSNWNFTDLAEDKLKVYGPYNIASILAHEMTHVAQFYFNMPVFNEIDNTPAYIYEGMSELTVGRFGVNRVNALAGNADSLNAVLNDFSERDDGLHYSAGFLFWHYLMKQTADSADAAGTDYTKDYSKLLFSGTEGADVGYAGYVNFGNGSNYSLGSGDDTLYIYGDNVSVDGGADNDRIDNHSANVTITGGNGADTVDMGGQWYNVLNYANGDGNDTVYNFHEHDQMNISGAAHSTTSSGDEVIVNVGDGQVVLKGANGKSLNIVNSYESTVTTPAAATDTVTSSTTETIQPATTDTVQPATVETVTPAREYAYTYNSGNMTISDYKAWENIKFNGTYSNWAVDGNDFIVNAAEGSLRVSDAKGKVIELYDGNNDLIMHALMQNAGDYFAGTVYDEEGNITDGTYYEKVVVIGAGDGDNTIAAGAGGSELWGNAGVNRLIGGEGEDTFIYNNGEGAGFIHADTEDTIKFSDVTFDQIRKIKFDADKTLFVFDNFNILNVTGQPENFIIGGQKYRADYNAKQLQEVHTN